MMEATDFVWTAQNFINETRLNKDNKNHAKILLTQCSKKLNKMFTILHFGNSKASV